MVKLEDYPTLKKPITTANRTLDKLRISIDYSKNGWSCLTGDSYRSGVYVYLTPCYHENGITGTCWDGNAHTMGYKILLKEIGRKSQKQIDLAAELIIPYAQQIADYYSDARHDAVYFMIMKLYKSDK